jgi:hypothetical protein
MLDLFNIAKPQGCDIQTFYGDQNVSNTAGKLTWSKPRGVSNVYMLLIGGGGGGNGSSGGSASVTVWYGSALNVPDTLIVSPARFANDTFVYYYGSGGRVILLNANGGVTGGGGGSAMTANQFAASGFFQSIAGVSSTGSTTFLTGGSATGNSISGQYGYTLTPTPNHASGYFQLQPIIVGMGGIGDGAGGIGCGGGSSNGARGGQGMILIASW